MNEVYCPVCGAVVKETYVNLVPDDCDEWHGRTYYTKYKCPNCKGVKTDDYYDWCDLEWKIPKKYPKTVTDAQLRYLSYLYRNKHIPYAHTKEVADMLIKKQLTIIKQGQYKLKKAQAFEDELSKHKIDPHILYGESRYLIDYETLDVLVTIDPVTYELSDISFNFKTNEITTTPLVQIAEDLENLQNGLNQFKKEFND